MRILLSFFLSALALFSLDFQPCYEKNSGAIYNVAGFNAVALDKHKLLIVADELPEDLGSYELIKTNKFLGIHLVKSDKEHEHIKLTDTQKGVDAGEVAVIEKKSYKVGKIVEREQGFSFAKVDIPAPKGSVIGIKCYAAVGVGTGEKNFIETKYIGYFMRDEPFAYGDIGVRFGDNGEEAVAQMVDPYGNNLDIRVGDKIIKVNGIDIFNAGQIKDLILFSKPGNRLDIVIIRDGKRLNVQAAVEKLLGESYEAETFLERFGVVFNKDLVVKKVKKDSIADGKKLRVGDRLIQVDRKRVLKAEEITKILSDTKSTTSSFLFQRSGLQFFVKLP